MINKPKRNDLIDAMRAIAISLVVYIHVFAIGGMDFSADSPWGKIVSLIFGIARLAVPLFFAISGWFVFCQDREKQKSRLGKQIPKLLKISVAATVGTSLAYFLLSIFIKPHPDLGQDVMLPSITSIFETFFFGHAPGVLWFLFSLTMVEIIYYVITRSFKKDNWIMPIALAIFVATLLFTTYGPTLHLPELPIPRENVSLAFVWFSLGYFLHKFNDSDFYKAKIKSLISFMLVASVFYAYEYILFTSGAPLKIGPYNYHIVFMGIPFVVAGIMLLVARYNRDYKIVAALANLGRNYALGVYIIHAVIINGVLWSVFRKINLPLSAGWKLLAAYSLSLLLSLATTLLYYAVKTRLGRLFRSSDKQ